MESPGISDNNNNHHQNQTLRKKKRSDRRRPQNLSLLLFPSNNGQLSDENVSNLHNHIPPNLPSQLQTHESTSDYHNLLKKLKLKVGSTIHPNPPPHYSTCSHTIMSREIPYEDYSDAQDKGSVLRGIPWKDFSSSGFSVGKFDSSMPDPIHKSKRVPKRRILLDEDEDDDDDDDDDDVDDDDDAELRYLAKMKSISAKFDEEDEGGSKKQRKISSVLKMESRKKSKTWGNFIDTAYTGEEQESADMVGADSKGMTVTTRRQALQSGRDISANSAASVIEFPHGLPSAPARKQKDKLSEVEHQLKKAEAAERRKIQAAKAAQESEAEAIRKILGQDSSRKKRENKMKQRQEVLAQERNSNADTLASNTVRWVIRPTGTIVTFSDDVGLPNIFESRHSSYPPPREKCAGPSCSKPFKYRDSRSKLPLCSLRCYKAVQERMQPGAVY